MCGPSLGLGLCSRVDPRAGILLPVSYLHSKVFWATQIWGSWPGHFAVSSPGRWLQCIPWMTTSNLSGQGPLGVYSGEYPGLFCSELTCRNQGHFDSHFIRWLDCLFFFLYLNWNLARASAFMPWGGKFLHDLWFFINTNNFGTFLLGSLSLWPSLLTTPRGNWLAGFLFFFR